MITRYIYPFSLRERISYHLRVDEKVFAKYCTGVRLAYNQKVKLDLNSDDVAHRQIILNGFYELDLTKRIHALAKKGGVMVDVGANYGYFSCLWGGALSNNTVIAFEANPENVKPLLNNIKNNGFEEIVKVEGFALGKEKGTMNFYLGDQKQTGWGGLALSTSHETINVEVDTLDGAMSRLGVEEIDVLKIDTEGADTWVLYGAERLLRERRIRNIFFEANVARMSKLGIGIDDAVNFLTKLKYKVQLFSDNEFFSYPI